VYRPHLFTQLTDGIGSHNVYERWTCKDKIWAAEGIKLTELFKQFGFISRSENMDRIQEGGHFRQPTSQ
jgi:hypothetical protein